MVLNNEQLIKLWGAATEAADKDPDISKVILFGNLVEMAVVRETRAESKKAVEILKGVENSDTK